MNFYAYIYIYIYVYIYIFFSIRTMQASRPNGAPCIEVRTFRAPSPGTGVPLLEQGHTEQVLHNLLGQKAGATIAMGLHEPLCSALPGSRTLRLLAGLHAVLPNRGW